MQFGVNRAVGMFYWRWACLERQRSSASDSRLGRFTTQEDIDLALDRTVEAVARVRGLSGHD